MSNAVTKCLAALAALSLFACGGGAVIDYSQEPTTTDESKTEPTLLSGDKGTTSQDAPRTADEHQQLDTANGAAARSISFNHPEPHTLVIPALDLADGRGGSFELSKGGGAYGELHTHDITLSPDQMSALRDGAELVVETTAATGQGGAHTHTVTISKR